VEGWSTYSQLNLGSPVYLDQTNKQCIHAFSTGIDKYAFQGCYFLKNYREKIKMAYEKTGF